MCSAIWGYKKLIQVSCKTYISTKTSSDIRKNNIKKNNNWLEMIDIIKGSYIEVYSGIEFPKHDFQFNYDTNCRIYVVILHHLGLSYNMF